MKADSLVNQCFNCLLSTFLFSSLLRPVHSIEREAECCNFERSLNILFYIMHIIVHTVAPSTLTWSYGARQRFLPLFLLCFTTAVAELVTSDSGHHPLFLAYHIFSEAIKEKRRKGWYVAVENCPVHLVWGWL